MPKYGRYLIIEFPLREALEEIAAGVFEYARLNDEYAINVCFIISIKICLIYYCVSASGVLVEREFSRIIRELKEMGPQADLCFCEQQFP